LNDVTQILDAIAQGDAGAAERLLPLVYDELRRLAAQKIERERPGQTLQATALVHEAYLRLVGDGTTSPPWNSRGHFFAAAAEAMRRILIEAARRRQSLKRAGGREREVSAESRIVAPSVTNADDLLALDDGLAMLKAAEPQAAEVVHLRYFAGLSQPEIAVLLNVSPRTVDRLWAYAKAWLHHELHAGDE
jgi:RNA polymerase sigma factor (TIGR02999 family)